MILHSLCNYYDRLQKNVDIDIPEIGFSQEKISFAIVIDRDGQMVGGKPHDIRDTNEKGKLTPRMLFVPKIKGRSGKNPPPYFLWDNAKYVLGGSEKDQKEKIDKDDKYKITEERYTSFKESVFDFFKEIDDEGVNAIKNFLNNWNPEDSLLLENWDVICKANFVFKLDTDYCFLHERPAIKKIWLTHSIKEIAKGTVGYCLISGEEDTIAITHPIIKGVQGGNSTGGALISFNKSKPSFSSYNKEQNNNAPVSEINAFKYTTALNHLCQFGSNQKIQIGDATTAFWAEKENPMETIFGKVIAQNNDGFDQDVKLFLEAIQNGKKPVYINEDTKFFILGLSPNAARISVRFWYASSVYDISNKLLLHFNDLKIEKRENDPEYPSIWRLLIELVPQREGEKRKSENIPPNLAGQMIQAILNGTKYPESFYSTLISRIRTDHSITYMRAAIIKAVLTRKYRFNNLNKEISMALDKSNKNIAYLLGRLFSVLEKVQQDAIPGANATIKDRYYGSASSTPKIVFPLLMKLSNHHISKAKFGYAYDKRIEEIIQDINEFPAHLNLEAQGEFAIGYYHQRNDLFKKKEAKIEGEK